MTSRIGVSRPLGHLSSHSGRKAVRTDRELQTPGLDKALRDSGVHLVTLPSDVAEETLIAAVRDADLLLMCYTPVTARVIDAAAKLKGIVKYGVGIDAIDIEAARRRGIPVVNIPEYAEETVAEGAFALLMALFKRVLPITAAVQAEGWVWPAPKWLGRDLAGATLGLVGAGRIGRSLARMAGAGFRMRVLGYDPYVSEADMANVGVSKVDDLHRMLAECDAVSIHAVLNAETRGLIGPGELACMKRTAVLVNVARGAIVDEPALVAALTMGQLAGAALDVYGVEPPNRSSLSALYGMENVILFPHLTFYTVEAMERLEADTLARCRELLDGEPVLVRSRDPRLLAQSSGVRFPD